MIKFQNFKFEPVPPPYWSNFIKTVIDHLDSSHCWEIVCFRLGALLNGKKVFIKKLLNKIQQNLCESSQFLKRYNLSITIFSYVPVRVSVSFISELDSLVNEILL